MIAQVLTLLAIGAAASGTAAAAQPTTRFDGDSPAEIAVSVAREVAGGNLRDLTHLLVASDEGVVDAALASGLAAYIDSCTTASECRTAVLLTGSETLDDATAAAIETSGVSPANVMVIGEQTAVSETVRSQIARAAGWNGAGSIPVMRIGGANRFETAAAIADLVVQPNGPLGARTLPASFDTVVVVNGYRLADLLVASALARHGRHPLVLAGNGMVPAATARALDTLSPRRVIVVGGPSSLSVDVESDIAGMTTGGGGTTRFGGADRYETSTLVAGELFGDVLAAFTLVSGTAFEDAAAVGILGLAGAPVLFTPPGTLPTVVENLLFAKARSGTKVMAVGGGAEVSESVLDRAGGILTFPPPPPPVSSGPVNNPSAPSPFRALTLKATTTTSGQQVTLPLSGTVDVAIDWGGPVNCPTTASAAGMVSCTYPAAGTYTIAISRGSGTGPWLTWFGNGAAGYADAERIDEVTDWGELGLTSLSGALRNATNVTAAAEPPVTVADMSFMFSGASTFDQDIGDWDTRRVLDMTSMFENAAAFDQDLSRWCVVGIPSLPTGFATGADVGFVTADHPDWGACPMVLRVTVPVNQTEMALPFAETADVVVDWGGAGTETDNYPPLKEWTYTTDGTYTIVISKGSGSAPWLPQFGLGYGGCASNLRITEVVSWGALGTTSLAGALCNAWNLTHVAVPPSGITDMSAMFRDAWSFNQNISDWDTSSVTSMSDMFNNVSSFNNGCAAGVTTCPLTWDTSSVTWMSDMFNWASDFNQNIGSWDMRNVNDVYQMFRNARAFNNGCAAGVTTCPLAWVTSSLTSMERVFYDAWAFNQSVSSWDISAVTVVDDAFYRAAAFNNGCAAGAYTCPLTWDTSSVTSMATTFSGASSFNQSVNTWDTALVTNMSYSFNSATAFNNGCAVGVTTCPLAWNTGSVTLLSSMFEDAHSFNQSVASWNTASVVGMDAVFNDARSFNNGCAPGVSMCPLNWITAAVTNMNYLFQDAQVFNQDISSWNTTGSVRSMSGMFRRAVAFDQDITGWNTGSVTALNSMFEGAAVFDQNIGSWNTGSVTNMSFMFKNAAVFDQDISSWNTALVTNMLEMFSGATVFNQNISGWCVTLINTAPGQFADGSGIASNTAYHPVWGTCPP